jgi:hypothetical protein
LVAHAQQHLSHGTVLQELGQRYTGFVTGFEKLVHMHTDPLHFRRCRCISLKLNSNKRGLAILGVWTVGYVGIGLIYPIFNDGEFAIRAAFVKIGLIKPHEDPNKRPERNGDENFEKPPPASDLLCALIK